MSDLFGNHFVGFPTRRLKYCASFGAFSLTLIFQKQNYFAFAFLRLKLSEFYHISLYDVKTYNNDFQKRFENKVQYLFYF